MINKPEWLIIHHTGGSDANPLQDSSGFTFEQCDALHKNNPLVNLGHASALGFYIGYHYYIDKLGKIKQGRIDTEDGAHCKGKNTTSLGICLAGNFDLTLPTDAQIKSLRLLLLLKQNEWKIPLENIVPHRRFAVKTCYGKNLNDFWAADLARPLVTNTTLNATLLSILKPLIKFFIN